MVKSEKKGDTKKVDIKNKYLLEETINNKIIENFVSLQRVMTNLAVKMEDLSNQISKLLELFEISAKAIADKDFSLGDNKINNQISEKLDSLIEQNKVIAKGITLLHEKETTTSFPSQIQLNQPSYQNFNQQNNPYRPKTIPVEYTTKNPSLNQRLVKQLDS
jgi:hypothetical protein